MLQTCDKDKWGLPGGQALLTLPSQLVSLSTGELKQVENQLQMKHVKRKRTKSSFPPQLGSSLLPSHPDQCRTSGSHPTSSPPLWAEFIRKQAKIPMHYTYPERVSTRSSLWVSRTVRIYGVLTTKSKYLRSLYRIHFFPQNGYLVQKLETAICITYPDRQEPPLN